MSISVNSLGRDELESITKKLLAEEIESKKVGSQEGIKTEVRGDTVTISEEGRALSQDKEKSGAETKQGSEKTEDSKKTDKAKKGDKAEGGTGAEDTEESQSDVDKLIENLKKKIKIVEQSIQEISGSNMPDDVKQTLLGVKFEQLSLLSTQLQELLEQKAKALKSASDVSSSFSVKI